MRHHLQAQKPRVIPSTTGQEPEPARNCHLNRPNQHPRTLFLAMPKTGNPLKRWMYMLRSIYICLVYIYQAYRRIIHSIKKNPWRSVAAVAVATLSTCSFGGIEEPERSEGAGRSVASVPEDAGLLLLRRLALFEKRLQPLRFRRRRKEIKPTEKRERKNEDKNRKRKHQRERN